MIPELLKKQKSYLEPYFHDLDVSRVEEIIQLLQECRGAMIFSGVGKSGYIAKKTVATLLSVGIRSFFLDPMQALHGDLGLVSGLDMFISFSKSGESKELVELMPYISSRGVKSIAIVSNERSRLARLSDTFICLPLERELCPFDLAPTTSTAVQLLFGDLLAVALMQSRKIPLEQISQNHPGGLIGRRIFLKANDLMLKDNALPLCYPEDCLIDVLHELSAKRCGCLLVTDREKKLLGVFTDGDLRRALQAKGSVALELHLQELMSPYPKTISPDFPALDALRCMEEDPARLITILPVLEQGSVVGLLRMHDILQAGLS